MKGSLGNGRRSVYNVVNEIVKQAKNCGVSFPSLTEVVGRVVLRNGEESGVLARFLISISRTLGVRENLLIDHGVRINPGLRLGSSGQFSLVLLSPVVVNAVVEEGEREELNADVEHLKVEVKVG